MKTDKMPISNINLPFTPLIGGTRKYLHDPVPRYIKTDPFREGQFVYFPTLAAAVEHWNLFRVERILMQGPSQVEFVDRFTGTTVLHVAAKCEDPILWKMLVSHETFVKFMDAPDFRGTTPLIAACWYENISAVKSLLGEGVDVSMAIRDTKKTALHVCAEHMSIEICELLLGNWNCNRIINLMDSEGDTPLMKSISHGSPTALLLLSKNADHEIVNPNTGRNIFHLAVAFSNLEIIKYCLANFQQLNFLNLSDINGDTPLNLAMRMGERKSVDLLLFTAYGKFLVQSCRDSVHSLVKENKRYILETIVSLSLNDEFFEQYDEEGRTPLLHAVELERTQIIEMFRKIDLNFEKKNYITGETVLHEAVYTQNPVIIDLIFNSIDNLNGWCSVEDNSGLTPYDIVLSSSNYTVWKMWIERTGINPKYENSSKESSLFIAAKEGNYLLVLALLLSKRFYKYLKAARKIDDDEIKMLEMKRLLFTSDIYIVLGIITDIRGWKTSPNQEHLFGKNSKGMTIFHACAIGGNLESLSFMYNYCKKFKDNIWQLDAPDDKGNTPLFYAVTCGWTEITKYLLNHGCNISYQNAQGYSPLNCIATNDRFNSTLEAVIIDCVRQGPEGGLLINYDLVRPQGESQMEVIWAMFDAMCGNQHIGMLTSPVIEYYILYKWHKIKHLLSFRLCLYFLLVFSFSMYLTFTLCLVLTVKRPIKVFRWLSLLSCGLIILFTIPMIAYRISHFAISLLTPIFILIFLNSNESSRENLELATYAVIYGWLVLLMGSQSTRMRNSVTIMQTIFKSVIKLLPLCIIVISGFSFCFFVLFHEYYPFNNPLRAFISLAVHMREGNNVELPIIPSLHPMEPMEPQNKLIFSPSNVNSKFVDEKVELRDLLVEGTLMLIYRLLVSVCAFNMLVDAAIRGVEEVENHGKLIMLKNCANELIFWEKLANSRMYTFFNKLYITWLIGLPLNLKTKMRIQREIYPGEYWIPELDLSALKKMFLRRKITYKPQPNAFKYIFEAEQHENLQHKIKNAFVKGSKAATSMAWMKLI